MIQGFHTTGQDKLEFRDLVLSHLKKILEISSHELRDSTKRIIGSGFQNIIEQEDTRASYIQSIENLSYILLPYFDDKMEKVYEECIKIIDGLPSEIRSILGEDCRKLGKEYESSFVLIMKLRYAKKLFIELNKLLHRNDYLRTSIYQEESGESE